MPVTDENGLKQQIRSKEYSNVYLFYGEEGFLKKLYVDRIVSKTVNDSFSSFNLHNLEGKDTTLDEIVECCEALPVMDRYCVTVVHDMALDKLTTVDAGKLKELVSDMAPSAILIFFEDTVQVEARDKKWSSVIELISKYGTAVNFSRKSAGEIVKLLINGAAKKNCVISQDTARYLSSVVGDDLNVLFNELEKLCLFKGEGEITKKDIDAVAVKSLEAKTFDLSKNLLAGNFERAYSILNTLFFMKTEPTLIMGTLISTYVDMYRAKIAVTNGESAAALAGYFNYKNKEFRLTNAARDASKLSVSQLREALEILADADKMLKNSFEESKVRLIIEQTMVKLMII